ncbi:MAG: hypothetical protein QOH81_3126 [Sphingomonadales bacterium]|jgi:hypothetical protein|nr:hypothetical protein [Sphingomonadales bacterium]
MIENWKDDLLREKSFQEVFRASRALPKSKFNRFLYSLAALIGVAAIAHWVYERDVQHSAAAATIAMDVGFNLSVPILGFLIAGFAIITTIANPRVMVRLAQTEQPDSKISSFKDMLFNFLSVFYIYIATLTVSVIAKLLAQTHLFDPEKILSKEIAYAVLSFANSTTFAVMGILIVFSIVRLKSFIWNIYQGFIIFLIVDDMMRREAG